MPEKYGVSAQLVKSIAGTPVPTDTTVVFIGACAGGDLNKAYTITSMADYATTLGGAVGDGYNLTEAAIAAFQIAAIDKVYMIPVSHSLEFTAADYIGDSVSTGAGAIVRFLARAPKTVVLVCAPSVTDSSVLAALTTACKKADGHWDSVLIYDSDIPNDAVNENFVFVDPSKVSKALSDEQAICCLGRAKVTGNYVVSMAALRACLMARSDAGYGVPARSGGNLNMPGVIAWGDSFSDGEPTKARGQYPATGTPQLTVETTFTGEIHPVEHAPEYTADGNDLEVYLGRIAEDNDNKVGFFIVDKRMGLVSGMIAQGLKNYGDAIPDAVTAEDLNPLVQGGLITFAGSIPFETIPTVDMEDPHFLEIPLTGATPSRAWCRYETNSGYLIVNAAQIGADGNNFKMSIKKGSAENTVDVSLYKAGALLGTAVFTGSHTFMDASDFESLVIGETSITEYLKFSGVLYYSDIPASDAEPLEIQLSGGSDSGSGAEKEFKAVDIPESKSTELSSNGICAVIHYSGEYYTWGDHTSAFNNESVADERARYDSNMRILLLLTNRFQLKYRFSIDDPMTLTVRNDIIQEENDYIAYLKSIGAVIGDAECRFVAADNPADNIALGQFVWSIESTVTPPMKYAQLNVAYSQAGLSVYYQ